MAEAQVHATLALADATASAAEGSGVILRGYGDESSDLRRPAVRVTIDGEVHERSPGLRTFRDVGGRTICSAKANHVTVELLAQPCQRGLNDSRRALFGARRTYTGAVLVVGRNQEDSDLPTRRQAGIVDPSELERGEVTITPLDEPEPARTDAAAELEWRAEWIDAEISRHWGVGSVLPVAGAYDTIASHLRTRAAELRQGAPVTEPPVVLCAKCGAKYGAKYAGGGES
jgi:hypothetical protein